MRRISIAVLIALSVASPLFAGPVEDLTKIIKDAMATAEPATALLKGFQSLGNISLTGPEVAKALADAGVPADGPVGQVLPAGASIKKSGSTIEISRPSETTIPLVFDGKLKGYVKVAKKVKFRVQKDGDGVLIDKFDGLQVGEKKDSFYDVWKMKFQKQNGKPVLALTAGWGLFSQTNTYDLPEPKPVVAPAPTPTTTVPAKPVTPPVTTGSQPPAEQPVADKPVETKPVDARPADDKPVVEQPKPDTAPADSTTNTAKTGEQRQRPQSQGPGLIQKVGGNN